MHHFPPKAWGGRVGRYAEFPRGVTRCFDPFEGKYVELAYERDYEAWLRQRFAASTLSITHSPTEVHAWIGNGAIRAKATFVVTDRHGGLQYHLVCGARTPRVMASHLTTIAKHNSARVVITHASELRQDVALFWRLERLRQACELHEAQGSEFDARIVAAANDGASSRSLMHQRFSQVDSQLLDARLGHLHCSARIRLNLESDDWGVTALEGGPL